MDPPCGCGVAGCPLPYTLRLLGDPYILAILYQFGHSSRTTLRFNELESAIPISPTTLSNRLKELVDSGLLIRRAYDENPPRVEYDASPHLAELEGFLKNVHVWANKFVTPPTASR